MPRIQGRAGVVRSGTGSARPAAQPAAAAGGTCGGRWSVLDDDVDHRCPGETRRTTRTSTSALVGAHARLADGSRAWSEGDGGGGDGGDDGTDGGVGAGADAGGADADADADGGSQGVCSSVLAGRHGLPFAC